jgi:hypothetical protein
MAFAATTAIAAQAVWASSADPSGTASTTISLDPAGLPVTASAYRGARDRAEDLVALGQCSFAGPGPGDRDVWIVQVNPPATGSSGEIVSVSATFQADEDGLGAATPDGEGARSGTPADPPGLTPTTGPLTTGSATTGSATTGSATTGSATTGSATTGPPTTRPATTRPATTRPATTRPGTTGPGTTGPGTAGSDATAGPSGTPGANETPGLGETATVTVWSGIDSSDGAVVEGSAWIAAPAGWELTGASAEVTGDAGTLELVAACPAQGASDQHAAVGLVDGQSRQPPPASAAAAQESLTSLPVAGTNVVPLVTVGTGLTLGGILLILFRGRRPRRLDDREQDDDIRRPVIVIRRS